MLSPPRYLRRGKILTKIERLERAVNRAKKGARPRNSHAHSILGLQTDDRCQLPCLACWHANYSKELCVLTLTAAWKPACTHTPELDARTHTLTQSVWLLATAGQRSTRAPCYGLYVHHTQHRHTHPRPTTEAQNHKCSHGKCTVEGCGRSSTHAVTAVPERAHTQTRD